MSEQYRNPLGGDFREEVQISQINESDLEKRREKLKEARETIISGSHLHIVDDVDIFKCEYLETGTKGLYEVVNNGAVVGYAKEPVIYSPGEITLN